MSRSLLLILIIPALLSVTAFAARNGADLEEWLAQELVPDAIRELSTHPRFRNQSIEFVVITDDKPQAATNALALSIRDQLRDAAMRESHITVPIKPAAAVALSRRDVDCTSSNASYRVGIEVREWQGGLVGVDVRVLDMEEKHWVSGFTYSWRGQLDARQRRQLRTTEIDTSLRGTRSAPFDGTESDLLAASLVHEIACALHGQTAGEYVVQGVDHATDSPEKNAMLELVGNSLADFRALRLAGKSDTPNATLMAKAFQVDSELFQYQVTVAPTDLTEGLPTISATAYVRVREKYDVAKLIPDISVAVAKSNEPFLGALRIVELRETQACPSDSTRYRDSQVFAGRYRTSAIDCYALQVSSTRDAVVFFLHHQLNHGLVRLSGQSCREQTDSRIVRIERELQFPLAIDSLPSDAWQASDGWLLNPDRDSYYAVAASSTKAARALAQHFESLPARCSVSMRSGLTGLRLNEWMEQMVSIMEHWQESVDWHVIRVKNMY